MGAVSRGRLRDTASRLWAASIPSATLKAFGDANTGAPLGSLETTHAVIRATLGSSFLYISGIVNRFGRFDEDVGGPGFKCAQNFVGAYNAGVALAWMLPMIDAVHNA